MKTLSEVKDIVAQRHGYADWLQIGMTDIMQCEEDEIKVSMLDDITLEYAKQAIDRAAEVAKITVNSGYDYSVDDRYYDNCSNPIVSYCIEPNKESILAVKQELK